MKKKPERKVREWFLPENLKKIRAKYKLSLDDVAYGTGISKSHLSQIESWKSTLPSIHVITDISDYLKKDIKKLCFTKL